jgi:hypothetical protein
LRKKGSREIFAKFEMLLRKKHEKGRAVKNNGGCGSEEVKTDTEFSMSVISEFWN